MANESRRTVSALVWLGGTLLAVGSLVLVLYGLYYFSVDFFESDDIPQGVKIAAPAAVSGTGVLLAAVIVQRLRKRGHERFEEAEY
jgi:hypothetical protein